MWQLTIGDISLSGVQIPSELQRKNSWKFDSQANLQGQTEDRAIGPEPGTFTCKTTLSAAVSGDLTSILASIQAVASKMEPVPVVLGSRSIGFYTIREIQTIEKEYSQSGKPETVEISFQLTENQKRTGLKWEWESNPKSKWD